MLYELSTLLNIPKHERCSSDLNGCLTLIACSIVIVNPLKGEEMILEIHLGW